ncbi:MAG: hypothetical protein RLY70_416, partial [Planctomycetota bacterium]
MRLRRLKRSKKLAGSASGHFRRFSGRFRSFPRRSFLRRSFLRRSFPRRSFLRRSVLRRSVLREVLAGGWFPPTEFPGTWRVLACGRALLCRRLRLPPISPASLITSSAPFP